VQATVQEVAAGRAVLELTEAKRQYMQKIVSWNLPDAKAKDIIFIVHMQLRRKARRVRNIYVCSSSPLLPVVPGALSHDLEASCFNTNMPCWRGYYADHKKRRVLISCKRQMLTGSRSI
jgi:hypothetical protein